MDLFTCGYLNNAGGQTCRRSADEGAICGLESIYASTPELFHVYYNRNASRRDHVLFYRVTVEQTAARKPDREIAESGFFSLDALPPGVTDATMRRLKELSGEAERSDYW